jgi:endonuclease YncB( thermonuclease family)
MLFLSLRYLGALLSFLCFGYSTSACAVAMEQPYDARVSRSIDGDSLAIEERGKTYQVRLWGIDAPEWGQPFSVEAREVSRKLVKGRRIIIRPQYRDRYDRIVAIVEVNGQLLNEEMVRRGMAWVSNRYCNEDICNDWRDLEKTARQDGTGLWADDDAVAPWEWKKLQKHQKRY